METTKNYAMRLVGLPYRWGGDDPIKGFDCSGLVIEILQSYGLLPKGFDGSAQALYDLFSKAEGSVMGRRELGSLVFFGKSVTQINHVGFMVDERRMIEAGGGGSTTTNEDAAAAQNAFVRLRPVKWRPDLVAVVFPKYAL